MSSNKIDWDSCYQDLSKISESLADEIRAWADSTPIKMGGMFLYTPYKHYMWLTEPAYQDELPMNYEI